MADDQPSQARTLRRQGLSTLHQYELSRPHDADLLRQAVAQLHEAFEMEDYEPETVWSLTQALRYVPDLEGIIRVLKRYAECTSSREQEFLARHYIVDNYALLRQHEAAVEWYRDLLSRMQGVIPADRLLWSLSDNTMLCSWVEMGVLSDWTAIGNQLYQQTPDTVVTCEARAFYLRTLAEAVYLSTGAYSQAVMASDQLAALVSQYLDQWLEARWMGIEVNGLQLSIYHAMRSPDLEAQAIMRGKQHLSEYERWLKSDAVLKEASDVARQTHRRLYHTAFHNFGCQCLWTQHYGDAVTLLEQALTIVDLPETHFYLAGAILQETGHRGKSLEHFRQAVEHPGFTRRHELQRAFLEEGFFEPVRGDASFQAVIDQENQKISRL